MRIPPHRLSKVTTALAWGGIALGAAVVFVADRFELGVLILLVVFAFSQLLRRKWFVDRYVRFMTGKTYSDVLVDAMLEDAQRRRAAADGAGTSDRAGTGAAADPGVNSGVNYWRDPVAMEPAALAAVLEATKEPAVRLVRHWPPETPSGANSWLGGTPNLPDGVDWPVNPRTGFALHHLAQVDLGEMPLPEGAPIPRAGMLWFFADIDEELCWDEGPDETSKVLYHPTSTAGRAPLAVPDTLPEVHHVSTQMSSSHFGFHGPNVRVFPRWPLHGVLSVAWEYDDSPPEGVTDPMAYHEAREAAIKSEKAKHVGAPIERPKGTPLIRTVPEQRTRPDGTPFTYNAQVFEPDDAFPYTNAFAFHLARRIQHDAKTQFSYGHMREWIEANIPDQAGYLAGLADLEARLAVANGADPAGAVAVRDAAEIRAILEASTAPTGAVRFNNVFGAAVVDVTAQAMSNAAVLNGMPDAVRHVADQTVLPSHAYTEHFLLGPKGSASNPTSGQGIRLAQFDSDYGLGMMFCDCGIVDFWISAEDLAAGRWDAAWAATAGG